MPVLVAALLVLAVAATVFFVGVEAVSFHMFLMLTREDGSLLLWEEDEEPQGYLGLREALDGSGPSLWVRVGAGWLFRLVDCMEGRRPRLRRLLWGLTLSLVRVYIVTGPAVDALLRRSRAERSQRRLGRSLLREIVASHGDA